MVLLGLADAGDFVMALLVRDRLLSVFSKSWLTVDVHAGQRFAGVLLAHRAADWLVWPGQVIEGGTAHVGRQPLRQTGTGQHGEAPMFDARSFDTKLHDAIASEATELE